MKYHIITYGCQMNKSDSERIAGVLNDCGWQAVDKFNQADLVILNSCSVRQSAEDRVYGEVDELAKLKKKNPALMVAVTGCMPGRDKEGKFKKKMPAVDLYFPINDLPRLPEMLSEISKLPIPQQPPLDYLDTKPSYQNNFSAFVPIQTGCNKFCTYCVVPHARGQEISRSLRAILDEVCYLAAKGFVEITLLGQTVNSYEAPDPENFSDKNPFFSCHSRESGNPATGSPIRSGMTSVATGDRSHFAALLWEVNQIDGLKRINFTAPHPDHMSDEVIKALTLPKQINYLHLPVQSGSDNVLAKMNRHYTAVDYLKIIKKIRAVRPGMALGTDIIVGFPGETKEDFEETVKLYKEADFDIAFLAKYSPRSGTAAYKMIDDVTAEEKERRWWAIQRLMEETTLQKNQKFVGQTLEVLVSRFRNSAQSKGKCICIGNSSEMKMVEFAGQVGWVGKIVKVKIEKAEMWRLIGQIVQN
ncbi:MAG: MiaB/RimO family radical SAM methylthiotransferase [Patescibacteria group bacterium]